MVRRYEEHGMTGTRTYEIWKWMRTRCRVGIERAHVCERWESFTAFLEDMGIAPEGLTIERIDSKGNYEPSNCRWGTPAEQCRYRRGTKLSSEKVVVMRAWHRAGLPISWIAAAMSVAYTTAQQAVSGAKWKGVQDHAI